MFKKRRNSTAGSGDEAEAEATTDATSEATSDSVDQPNGWSGGSLTDPRADGPRDSSEIRSDDEVIRLDFGSVKVPGVDGMSVSLEVDEASDQVVAITVALDEGAVQLQAFAAPRSGGFWEEVCEELAKGITESGGTVDRGDGPLGLQLSASVPAVTPEGENVMQQVRFVGVEGPRWLLRGVMLGAAAGDARSAEVFEDVFRGCIVDRGGQPMAPGDLLPLQLPPEAQAAAEDELDDDEDDDADARPPLDPFERGPEITEIR